MPRTLLLTLCAALLPGLAVAEQALIKLITEDSPFTRVSAENDTGGEATRFIAQVLADADIAYELQYLPWRRAYDYVSREPGVLIYPLARNAQRESRFHWVGELIPVNYYLFKLRERKDINVASLDDARRYRIGVVNYHVHHEYLLAQGFSGLQPVNSNAQNIKKALLQRIDLFPFSDGGMVPVCERESIDCSLFEPVLKLEGISGGLYMAYSLATPAPIVDASRQSYQRLLRDGTHERAFQARLETIEHFNTRWSIDVARGSSIP